MGFIKRQEEMDYEQMKQSLKDEYGYDFYELRPQGHNDTEDYYITPNGIKVKHLAPLYCGSPITMVANRSEGKWLMQAYDHRFTLAVDMEIEPHEL